MKPLCLPKTYPNLKEMIFVDIPEIIGLHKTKMYMGGGIEFHHDNPDIHKAWHKIAENNNAYNFLFERVKAVSKTGGTIIAVEQTESGVPVWSYADPYLVSSIEQSYVTQDFAVFIQKVKIDNSYCLMKCAYDKEYIYRQAYNYDDKETQINLLGFISKLPENKRIKWGEYDKELGCWKYKHGLGMLPFVVIPNSPFIQTFPCYNIASAMATPPIATAHLAGTGIQKWQFNQLSDTYSSEPLTQGLQYTYNIMFKTEQLDKPRFVISNASQYLQNKAALGKNTNDIAWQDILFFANAPASAQTKIQTMPMTNSIEKYADLTQTLMSQIYKNAGLDYIVQSGTNKTTSENYLNFANTKSTVESMKFYITDKIIQLIRISLKFMGYDLDEEKDGKKTNWNFLVKSKIPTDMSALRQDLSIDLKNGIIDQADMYSILYGVDRDQAENKIEQVKKYNQKVGFDPMAQNVDGVSYPKDGQSSANSKNAGRKTDVEKNKKE